MKTTKLPGVFCSNIFDPVQLTAGVCSHPAQVGQEDGQLAQAALQVHLQESSEGMESEKILIVPLFGVCKGL